MNFFPQENENCSKCMNSHGFWISKQKVGLECIQGAIDRSLLTLNIWTAPALTGWWKNKKFLAQAHYFRS